MVVRHNLAEAQVVVRPKPPPVYQEVRFEVADQHGELAPKRLGDDPHGQRTVVHHRVVGHDCPGKSQTATMQGAALPCRCEPAPSQTAKRLEQA